MATIVIPLDEHHAQKGTFAASWRSFHKSINHAEEFGPTWHTEGGALRASHDTDLRAIVSRFRGIASSHQHTPGSAFGLHGATFGSWHL